MKAKKQNGKRRRLIFRPYIRTRSGKIIWAYQYGLKAFPIWVT